MGYSSDREFTDYVHNKLAIPLIYEHLSWFPQELNDNLRNNVDIFNAVDQFLIDAIKKKIITVQERFREYKYRFYNDFTIRYEREFNSHIERKKSEFFKLDCEYFVYGIVNSSKFNKEQATDFVKYAVIDVKKLKELFDKGNIVVDKNLNSIKCSILDNKLHCPINYNHDRSSSFIPIDIKMLLSLFPNNGLVLSQKGFI